jgi:hypothetical protein
MAKVTGLAAVVTIDDAAGAARIISNDITNFDFASPVAVEETTGVDKSFTERLLLLGDASATFEGIPNFGAVPSATSHGVFASVTSTRVSRTVALTPSGGASAVWTCEMLLTDYQIKRSNAGELTFSVPAVLADGNAPVWT